MSERERDREGERKGERVRESERVTEIGRERQSEGCGGGVLRQEQSDALHCHTDRSSGTDTQCIHELYIHPHMPAGETDGHKQSSLTWTGPLVNDIQTKR